MFYFAYGSNMSIARIQARIPAEPVVGVYRLSNYRLRFNKLGADNSSKANIVVEKGNLVYGRLYQIRYQDRIILDEIEGGGYDSVKVKVHNDSGDENEAFCYTANTIKENIKPYDWYLKHIMFGAVEAHLPEHYCKKIAATQFSIDTNLSRKLHELGIYNSENWSET